MKPCLTLMCRKWSKLLQKPACSMQLHKTVHAEVKLCFLLSAADL